MKKLRPYQNKISKEIYHKLVKLKLCYLHSEVRTGKTLMALEACKLYEAKKVLFLTKKKAISSIENDYKDFGYTYDLTVINYESVHKIEYKDFDVVIYDEAHTLSGFPKAAVRTKQLKKRFYKIPCVFLTGTPAIESGSQWYHQFYVSDYSPFKGWTTFYKWAKSFVDIVQIDYGYGRVNNYDDADRDKIQDYIHDHLITFTQKAAGFETNISENILYYDINPMLINLSKRLIKDKVIEGKNDVIIADTAVKVQNKVHQILNGSCILESGATYLLDHTKAIFIRKKFKGKKLVIFYYYKGELEILKKVFDNITTDLDEFNVKDCHIAIQQTGSEGMNLSDADAIVYYNFGFSGKNYVQSRDRLTVMGRKENDVYFIFGKGGINEKIYKRVKDKKNFNVRQFNQEYGISK